MILNLDTWYLITKLRALSWGWLSALLPAFISCNSFISRTGPLWDLVYLLMLSLFRPNLGSHIVDFFVGVTSWRFHWDEILQKSRHYSFSYKLVNLCPLFQYDLWAFGEDQWGWTQYSHLFSGFCEVEAFCNCFRLLSGVFPW